jgi:hypothetical protein
MKAGSVSYSEIQGSPGIRAIRNAPWCCEIFTLHGRFPGDHTSYPQEDVTMQYLLLIYEDEKRWATMDQDAMNAGIAEYRAFGNECAKAIVGGNALQPTGTATTVRVRDGKRLITDGPFAETKEQLGGYYLIEAKNLDDAIAVAEKIPGARAGSIEVRPIMTFS